MANGSNEPLTFTRGDSDRLVRIEDNLQTFLNLFKDHLADHKKVRTRATKFFVWGISSSGGVGLLVLALKWLG